MPSLKVVGTVLVKRPFGESDVVVDVLTVTRGLEPYVAKGAQRSKKRLVGGLEPFTQCEFTLYQSRATSMPIVQDLKVLTSRFDLYRDLETFKTLCEVMTFLTQALPRSVPEYEICELVESLLDTVSAGGYPRSLALSFYLRAAKLLGWELDVGVCAKCKRPPGAEGDYVLELADGRIFCPACTPAGKGQGRERLSRDEALGLFRLAAPPRLNKSIRVDARVGLRLKSLIDKYLFWHTDNHADR